MRAGETASCSGPQRSPPSRAWTADPADGGVDVQPEEVGEDRGREVGREADQRAVAGGSGSDAGAVEQFDQVVVGEVLAGHESGEEPVGGRRG